MSPTEFYVRKPNWEIMFAQLSEKLKRELEKDGSGHNIRRKDLLDPGFLCAYVNRAENIYRRAMLVTSSVKNAHLQAKLFLIDTGKYTASNDSNLFYLGKPAASTSDLYDVGVFLVFCCCRKRVLLQR